MNEKRASAIPTKAMIGKASNREVNILLIIIGQIILSSK